MKASFVQGFVEYLLHNLFDIATILVAGYLVIRHQVQPFAANDIAELASWILAVLGLIAVSGLWDRNRRLHRIERLSEESRDLVLHRLSRKAHAGDFFLADQRLSFKAFTSANAVFLSGMTLGRTIRDSQQILSQRLAAGAYVRIIILDPTIDSILHELTLRSAGNTTAEEWRARLQTTEADIRIVAEALDGDGKGELEVRYLPYIPSFGVNMVDPDEEHGFCYVELYHHKSTDSSPAFELRASDDPLWYSFFRRQYELLWDSCRMRQFPETTKPFLG